MLIMEVERAEAAAEQDYWMAWFSDTADGSQRYVMVQLAKEFDEQDRASGMDAIYLEINDQSHGGYGLISGIQLGKDIVILEYDAQSLGLPAEHSPIQIRCAGSRTSFEQAQARLSSMASAAAIEVDDATTV